MATHNHDEIAQNIETYLNWIFSKNSPKLVRSDDLKFLPATEWPERDKRFGDRFLHNNDFYNVPSEKLDAFAGALKEFRHINAAEDAIPRQSCSEYVCRRAKEWEAAGFLTKRHGSLDKTEIFELQWGEKLAAHQKLRDRDTAGLEEVLSSASLKRARPRAPTSLPSGKHRRQQSPPVSSLAQALPGQWHLSTFFPRQSYEVARNWRRGCQNSIEVNGKTCRVDDFIEVYHGKNHHDKNDGKHCGNYDPQFSFGRIRRLRPGKVLVEYLYWPEQLESGRQSYHSNWELIGSDHWQVLSVESLVRVVEVNYWDEEEEVDPPRGRFWRQTYITRTKELSNLKAHCICDGPSNPDIPMFICDSHHCRMRYHKTCLEEVYRDLFVGFEAEIFQGARVLQVKILRGVKEISRFNVSCYRCGTLISLEDTILEGSERDSLENTFTTNIDDEIHRKFNFADLLSLLSFHLLSRVEQRSLLSEFLNMAKESSGWEPKLLKTRYPWLEDNAIKSIITLSDYLRTYSSQCEAAQKKPSIDNIVLRFRLGTRSILGSRGI